MSNEQLVTESDGEVRAIWAQRAEVDVSGSELRSRGRLDAMAEREVLGELEFHLGGGGEAAQENLFVVTAALSHRQRDRINGECRLPS